MPQQKKTSKIQKPFVFSVKNVPLRFKIFIMGLKDILVISGHGGLFKFISQGHNCVIVENLCDQKRMKIPATAKISMLEEIAVFTQDNDTSLREVFKKIQTKENGGMTIPHKSPDADLKKYFVEILPDYDQNRVYISDIRKVLLWYNLLHDLGFSDFEAPEEEKKEGEAEETVEAKETAETEKADEIVETSVDQ